MKVSLSRARCLCCALLAVPLLLGCDGSSGGEEVADTVPAVDTVAGGDSVAPDDTVPAEDAAPLVDTVPAEDAAPLVDTVPTEDAAPLVDTVPPVDVEDTVDTPAPTDAAPSGDGALPDSHRVDGGTHDAASADVSDDIGEADTSEPELFGEVPAPSTLGGRRAANLVVPSTYDATERLPLVVLLGGYAYLAEDWDMWLGASDRVDEAGFLLLLPDGTRDLDGEPFWNATDTCCDYYESGVDDAGWLFGLIDEAIERAAADPARVFLVGHSNGGFMAYRMACDAPERIAAVISVAGSSFFDPSLCGATAPVSVLQIHGTVDDIMPFGGDSEAPGALAVLARWAERAGCDADGLTPVGSLPDIVDGLDTSWERYASGCAPGVDISLWRIDGADHYPDFTWDFFDEVLVWAGIGL